MTDHALLLVLARVPFLSLTNATLLLSAPHASVARAAERLRAAGLVERVPLGGDKTMLYCLTDDGIIAVAHAHGTEPATVALAYGLGHRALLARLPALARHLDAQDAFAPLIRALMQAPRVTVTHYRLGTLRWGHDSSRTLALDGQVTLETAAGRRSMGLLWDGDDEVPVSVLHDRLDQLADVSQFANIPPVLVVTHAPERMPWPYPSGILWTTAAELDARGHLEARWVLPTVWGMGMDAKPVEEKSLLAALIALPTRCPDLPPLLSAPYQPRPGRRLNLEVRLTMLRQGGMERKPTPPRLLALALPPRALYALQVVGQHPLLRASQLAEVCDDPPARLRMTLAWLAGHGLVAPNVCDGEQVWRYVLTRRGLRLLAAQADLPAATFRETYAVLEDTDEGTQRGLDFAAANLTHTTELQDVFFAFLRAARARGAGLSWRWEWASTQTFDWEGERYLLRPDADVVYEERGRRLHLFVELDRSTRPLGDIAGQLARYHHYAQNLADEAVGGARGPSDRPTVLVAFVAVKSEQRARNIIATSEAVSAAEGRGLVDIRATYLKRLLRKGAMEKVWWRAGQRWPTLLLPEAARERHGVELQISGRRFTE